MTTVHIKPEERHVRPPRISFDTQWMDREDPRPGTEGVIRVATMHGIRVATLVTVQRERRHA